MIDEWEALGMTLMFIASRETKEVTLKLKYKSAQQ